MAGWSFLVTPQSLAEYRQALDRDAILAQWTTGAMGIRWIDRLVDEGRAERIEDGGGYPDVYTLLARDVVPLLGADQPPSDGESAWAVTIHDEALGRLLPDARLTVVVWDQS